MTLSYAGLVTRGNGSFTLRWHGHTACAQTVTGVTSPVGYGTEGRMGCVHARKRTDQDHLDRPAIPRAYAYARTHAHVCALAVVRPWLLGRTAAPALWCTPAWGAPMVRSPGQW